jgi:small subunit ribosomal protein S2
LTFHAKGGYLTGLRATSIGPRKSPDYYLAEPSNQRQTPAVRSKLSSLTPSGISPRKVTYARDIAGVPTRSFLVSALVQDLVEAGVHYGHRASRWNPKMRPYIYARKNLIHIIDVRETVRGLLRAKKYLTQIASQGSLVLFVGTKRQAADAIGQEAQRCGMPFVNDRWLGGTLTNFRTIRSRLGRLEELEEIRESEKINSYSKKMQSSLNREYRKMHRNLNGIRTMSRLPECLIIVDPKKEKNAVSEAQKLGVATVALIDTDCDPDVVDLPIPGNDDSMRSIEMIMKMLADAIHAGKNRAAVASQHANEGAEVAVGV